MTNPPTPHEAARLLGVADRLRGQVARGGAPSSRAYIGWGLFAVALLPPFDFVDGDIWGPIFTLAAVVGWLATTRYYRDGLDRARVEPPGRLGRLWVAWSLWYAALVVTGELLHDQLGVTWSPAAVGAGLPLLLYGTWLARRGR